MPMQRTSTRGTGLASVKAPMRSGSKDTDLCLQAWAQSLQVFRDVAGVVLTPGDDISAALSACRDGDRVLLLPGTYFLRRSIAVSKRVTIMGYGATLEFDAGASLSVTADYAVLEGFACVQRAASGLVPAFLTVTANRVLLHRLFVDVDADQAVRVTGDYCSVQACRFDGSRPALGSDVYFADGATYGIACGIMWSAAAGAYSLDYRAIDLTSEAANGPAAIINVR